MHFGFALDLPDLDLLNIDLLDQRYTHLDLLVSITSSRHVFNTSSRYFFKTSSRLTFKTSSRHVFKKSWRRLQGNNFSSSKTSSRRFPRCLHDVFKTSSRRLGRRKIVTLKTCWRRLQDMSWRRHQDVLKTNKCLLEMIWKSIRILSAWKINSETFSANKIRLQPQMKLS